jgi:succinoglycan biosynthesis transport protein ExoP
MTTLPQTTTLRLPRPAAGGQLSAPAAIPLGMLPPSSSASQMTGADAWRVIRVNIWLVLLVTILCGVGGYFLYSWLLKNDPKYTATALLSVSSQIQADPTKDYQTVTDLQGISFQLKTNAQLLKNRALFSEVLQDAGSPVHDTQWIKEFSDPELAKNDLADHLSVTPSADTALIRIDMSTRYQHDGEKIIEAVVGQHIKDQEQENKEIQERRSAQLTAKKEQYEMRNAELGDEMNDKQSTLNLSGTEGGSGRLNIKYLELGDLNKQKMLNELALADAKSKYDDITGQITSGQDPQEVSDRVNANPDVQRYREYINNIDIQLLGQGDQFGDSNTSVMRMKQQKDLFQSKLEKAQADALNSARASVQEVAKRELDSAQRAVDEVVVQMHSLDGEIAELNKTLSDYNVDKDERQSIVNQLKDVDGQLEQVQQFINQKNLATIEWKSHPESSDLPTFPDFKLTMGMSILVGLMLSLGIAFIRELLDTSVRSPRDISRVGHMTLLGMVPHEDDDPQSQGARLPLVIFEAPQSMMAEQLRQVRTRLQHGASLDTTRSILITSPGPDDGKSTIACNLASGLALNGRRILLVDANFRRPSLHRTFNLGNDHGFSDVLNSLDLFETSVQETVVPNLYVLPSGLKPTNATELLESQLLLDFIERALEEFDHVIFDSGPLLFVSETVALAPRVDGVVTVVRARSNSRGVLQRMRDSLRQIKAEHLGVVLNAVRATGGGYYRSNIRTYYDYQNDRAA